MSRFTDLQSLLLTHAAADKEGALTPLPTRSAVEPARMMTAITQLLRRGLLEEREVEAPDSAHREDGDVRYGAFITVAGLAAIGVESEPAADETGEGAAPVSAPSAPTKAALVLDLLRHEQGATLAELIAATGWLPHTTRAALTGLRRKGHSVERFKREDTTCYRIAAK